jgi:glycosyltransferase involved in cell wall biosynthesis
MEQPLFSIIIPTYNRAYIVTRAIDSVIAQTYPHWELIIVDDGSSDATESVVTAYSDPRIRMLRQVNKGPSAARNTGIMHAKGEWIAYLDSDDEFSPQYLETLITWITQNPDTLYLSTKYVRMIEVYKDGKEVAVYEDSVNVAERVTVTDFFLRNYYFSSIGFMHARKIIEAGIRWDETLVQSEDWDFFMQIAERFPDNFLYVPIALSIYHRRMGTDGLSSNTAYKQMADAFEYIYQKHKASKLLVGQTWYPGRVEKYLRLHQENPQGTLEQRHWKNGVVQKKKRVEQ